MLKFLYMAKIFNFRTFLVDFNPNFNHVVLSRLDELLDLIYIVGNLKMSSFQPNLNNKKIPPVALYISQVVNKSLIW